MGNWKRVEDPKEPEKKWAHVDEPKAKDKLEKFMDIYYEKRDDFMPSLNCFAYGNERDGRVMWAVMKIQKCLADISNECADAMNDGYISNRTTEEALAKIFVYLQVIAGVQDNDVTDIVDEATGFIDEEPGALR